MELASTKDSNSSVPPRQNISDDPTIIQELSGAPLKINDTAFVA
jgi:hypothetical protein